MTSEAWNKLELKEQLSNVHGEVKRLIRARNNYTNGVSKEDYTVSYMNKIHNFGSARKNLVFIVCGSATSWLVDNIEHNKGGLFNRQSCKVFLNPFTLHETEEYLVNKNFSWSRYDIAELYMILGGIPYYLSLLDSSMSYSQNIDNLFFSKKSELWDEFDHLYNTLFKTSDNYIKIVSALSKKKEGCTRTEICAQTGLPANGNFDKDIKKPDRFRVCQRKFIFWQ